MTLPAETPLLKIVTEAYLGDVCYRAFLYDTRGLVYLLLDGEKYLPFSQWDGASSWDPGIKLPKAQVQILREVGRFNEPCQPLEVSYKHTLDIWGTPEDHRWYHRPNYIAHEANLQKATLYWPQMLNLEGDYEQPALIALLRQELQKLYFIDRRLICQVKISVRRPRGDENLLLLKHRAAPIDQVRWEIEDLIRTIQNRLHSTTLHLWIEIHDITAQPNVLNLLISKI